MAPIFSITAEAADQYRPYLHNPEVPEHPDLKMQGSYQTALWPGAATYSYGIQVPPGRNGLQPSLGISYNSHSTSQRPGVVGTAWTLSQNYVWRDVDYSFADTSNDKFNLVLNGQSYELVYVPSEGRYHTKIESFLHITKVSGGSNDKGEYWIVKAKDGTTYRFGYNQDSELISNIHNYVTRWSLDLIKDTHGNEVYYSYSENPASNDLGAVYPLKIEYNNEKARAVEFVLEDSDRPDKWLVYEQGNKVRESRRIKEIVVKANGKLVRKYGLAYTSIGTRSFLSSIAVFGSDGTSLPPTTFEYNSVSKGWAEDSAWQVPADAAFGGNRDYGVRLVDFNRDGLVDLTVDGHRTWVNTGAGWAETGGWSIPYSTGIVDSDKLDTGVRFVELNGDGLTDAVRADGPATADRDSWLNTGSGWSGDQTDWHLPTGAHPINIDDDNYDRGRRFVDLNGDGLTDILGNAGSYQSAWINNGNGWTEDGTWTPPPDAEFVDSLNNPEDQGTRIDDVNGDGLPDLIRAEFYHKTWLNTGNGWALDDNYAISQINFVRTIDGEDEGVRLADVNGDGLVDLLKGEGSDKRAWINTGAGWTADAAWAIPELASFVTEEDGDNKGVRIVDVNGDGLPDLVKAKSSSDSDRKTWINKGSGNYLLNAVTNGFGGKISIDYDQSTLLDNTGADSLSDLGFNLWVVDRAASDNGVAGANHVLSMTDYSYLDGLYDYDDREFKGFNRVREIQAGNSIATHWFHQDDALKGREFRTELFNSSSSPFRKTEINWISSSKDGYNIVQLSSEVNSLYDGSNLEPRVTGINYSYDAYGNVISSLQLGEVKASDDEKNESWKFIYNADKWIVDKPSHYTLFGPDGKKARETFYRYDELPLSSPPIKGDLTWEEHWLDSRSNPVVTYKYDDYGNLVEEKDARGFATTYKFGIYDPTFTFNEKTINPAGHAFLYTYDLGTGNLLSETDANGNVKSHSYDALGRIKKDILPYDSEDYPTKEYAYMFDGTAPEGIKVSQRENSGAAGTLDTYYFYDGFGNLVQVRSEAENSEQVVTNFYYDELGRLVKLGNPYFAAASEGYTSPNQAIANTSYTYDALSRVVKTENPDKTSKAVSFDRWKITYVNEKGNKKVYNVDAYDQIREINEYVGNNYYTTEYAYDLAGNIVRVKDAYSNLINYTYDSIGRKVRQNDPDLGTSEYSYDKNGNIVAITDNSGETVSLEYDELDRVVEKKGSDVAVKFFYDSVKGTLAKAESSGMAVSYDYDQRLRKIKETASIDGMSFTTGWEYDSAGRVTKTRMPDGSETAYDYNSQGLVEGISGVLTDIDYNAVSAPFMLSYGNSLVTSYSYNPDNFRIHSIKTGDAQELLYSYDASGNIAEINDNAKGVLELMGYDGLDRLAKWERKSAEGQKQLTFAYDSLGDITSVLSESGGYTYYYGNSPRHSAAKIVAQAGEPEDPEEPSKITIVSPLDNADYAETRIDLNWTTAENLVWCAYKLNNASMNESICQMIIYQENAEEAYSEPRYVYLTYSKPTHYKAAIWQVKHGNLPIYNVSIPSGCWNAYTHQLKLRLYSTYDGSISESYGQCHNGVEWQTITEAESATGTMGGTGGGSQVSRIYDGNYQTDAFYVYTQGWFYWTSGSKTAVWYEEGIWWETAPRNTTLTAAAGVNELIVYGTSKEGHPVQSDTIHFTVDTQQGCPQDSECKPVPHDTIMFDDFNDGMINDSIWISNGLNGGTLAESDGNLYFETGSSSDQQIRTLANIGAYDNFTLALRMKIDYVSGDKNSGFWLGNLAEGQPGESTGHRGYYWQFHGKTRGFNIGALYDGNNSGPHGKYDPPNWEQGKWHDLKVERAAGVTKFYFDGALVGTDSTFAPLLNELYWNNGRTWKDPRSGEDAKISVDDFKFQGPGQAKVDGQGKICPAVCMPMWEMQADGSCKFDECGSGCGPDNLKTFWNESACKFALSGTSSLPIEGEPFTIAIWVESSGELPTSPAVRAFADGVEVAVNMGTASKTRFSYTATLNLNAGTHTILIVANSDFAIKEGNYVNNVREYNMTVYPKKPDLLITGISYSYSEALAAILVNLSISNLGGTAAVSTVNAYLDSNEAAKQSVELDAGATKTVRLELKSAKGAYRFSAVVDEANAVAEHNESNNELSETIYLCSKEKVLVVDDNDAEFFSTQEPSSSDDFLGVLRNNGYCAEVWDEKAQGPPGSSDLNNFKAVVWSVGDYFSGTISNADAIAIGNYTKGILIEGSDVGLDLADSDFLQGIAAAVFASDMLLNESLPEALVLKNHPITEGIAEINISKEESPYPDGGESVGSDVVAEWQNGKAAITAKTAATDEKAPYRTAYYGFSVDGVTDAAAMEKLVLNTVEWLLVKPNSQPQISEVRISAGDGVFEPAAIKITMKEGETKNFSVMATDPDNDPLTYTWLLNGTVVSTTQNFSFSPKYNESGDYNLTIIVSDGKAEVRAEFVLVVLDTMDCEPLKSMLSCPLQLGVCKGSVETCSKDGKWLGCNAQTYLDHSSEYETIEASCDGFDNDCNGQTDEGFGDIDSDGIADCVDNDNDNDNVPDDEDDLIGNDNDVNITGEEKDVKISMVADPDDPKTKFVVINNSNKPLLQFRYNFSKGTIPLRNISIEKQSSGSDKGFILVKGLNLKGKSKQLFVDRLVTGSNAVCIKDKEVSAVTDVTSSCDGNDETSLECDFPTTGPPYGRPGWTCGGGGSGGGGGYPLIPKKLGPVCPLVCMEMWELKNGKCEFTNCGSGCGADNLTTFAREDECELAKQYYESGAGSGGSGGAASSPEECEPLFCQYIKETGQYQVYGLKHSAVMEQCVDADLDTYLPVGCSGGLDCNDNDNKISPAASEVCNGADDNCNGQIDENRVCNRAPALQHTYLGNKTVQENELLAFPVRATDDDGDNLVHDVKNLPQGAILVDTSYSYPNSFMFHWIPSFEQAGVYTITFNVSDGLAFDYETINITVANTNRAPRFENVTNQTASENSMLKFFANATDPDGDQLSLTVEVPPKLATAQFDTAKAVFSWFASFEDADSYKVTFKASDGKDSAAAEINITVFNVNRPPRFENLTNQTVFENSTLQFFVNATDPDNQALEVVARERPAGSVFADNVFSWKPMFDDAGGHSYETVFELSDGQDSVSASVNITVVNVNRAPAVSGVYGNLTVNETQTVTIAIDATDPDGDALSYAVNDARFTQPAPGSFEWLTGFSDSGTYEVLATVSDSAAAVQLAITVTVNNVNRPPRFENVTNHTVLENSTLKFFANITDPDNDLRAVGVELPAKMAAAFNHDTYEFSWQPTFDDAGSYTVIFIASDGQYSASAEVNVTVLNANRLPRFENLTNHTVMENSTLRFFVNITDPDNDVIQMQSSVIPARFATAGFDGSEFVLKTTFEDAGKYELIFGASDGQASVEAVVNITVLNINRAPELLPVGNKTVMESEILSFVVQAEDPDGDFIVLGLDYQDEAAGISFDAKTGELEWTPTFDQAGAYALIFNVTDLLLTDYEEVNITVLNVNRPPVILMIIVEPPGNEMKVGEEKTFSVLTDYNDDQLIFTWKVDDELVLTSRPTYKYVPKAKDAGKHIIEVTVSDGKLSSSQRILVTVLGGSICSGIVEFAEFGIAEIDHRWKTIALNGNYKQPVVIAKPLSFNGQQPAHIRIKDVTPNSFKVKVEEWKYLDSLHIAEKVSYVAMEAGRYSLGGKGVEAGITAADHRYSRVGFSNGFPTTPVVLTQSQTFNGSDPIVTRNRNVGAAGFEVKVQEEENSADNGWHKLETVGYIAAELGVYEELLKIEVGRTGNSVTDKWSTIPFIQSSSAPLFLADMQTANGPDTASLRYKNLGSESVQVKVEEEKSKDVEVFHVPEVAGYFVIPPLCAGQ